MMELNRKILSIMLNELKNAPSVYSESKFWKDKNQVHLNQLIKKDINNFKRTVNMSYFNWGTLGIIYHQLSPIIMELRKKNFSPILYSRYLSSHSNTKKDIYNFNFVSALIYKIFVASLYDYVTRQDKLNILKRLDEPLIGNPLIIKYKNKLISQDLCNSVHEFYSVTEKIDFPKNIDIAEIGAGYGRLAYVFLNTLPKASYCIIDIPLALYISQEYLSKVFPQDKFFYFRPFKNFNKVAEEFLASRIRFIMPHQIKYIPKEMFDLVINISSLHEMTFNQIKNYMNDVSRICKGYFYTKQWRKSKTKDNSFIKEEEYPIPNEWKVIYKHRHPIQNKFFEALYKIRS